MDKFLDGTIISDFFINDKTISINDFKNKYYLKDYCKPNVLETNNIQALIDNGEYRSNWSVLRENTATNNKPYIYDND